MSKNERKRTMVYSNVNKKADSKSASNNNKTIDLSNEIVIGLATFPSQNEGNKKSKNNSQKKIKNGQVNEKKGKDNNSKKTNDKENKSKINKSSSKKIIEDKPQITMQEKIRRKKIKIIKRMSTILLAIILLIGGVVYFMLSPVFNIKSIEVINNNNINSARIINKSGIVLDENMFKFSKNEARRNILSDPYIENVKISRNIFNNKIQINVEERIATLMLEYGNSYVYINNQGYILEISTTKLDSPILKGYVTPVEQIKPGNRLNKEDLERLETVLSIIETANSNNLENLITQIDINDTSNYTMTLETEDKTVYLGSCSNLSTQMLYVKEMVNREKGIEGEFFVDMDLNTGRPVFREKV